MDSNTLYWILLAVFLVLILLIVLAGVFGFIKGIYKTTLKTILKAILVLISVFVSPYLANVVGQINIQNLTHSSSPITIQLFVANFLTSTGLISPINGLSLYETAIALTNSLLSYLVFFVSMLFIQLFVSLLTAIFYQGIFRFLLPVEDKKERKKRKQKKEEGVLTEGLLEEDGSIKAKPKKKWKLLRPLGAVLGTVQELIFVFVLIAPVTSLAKTGVRNEENIMDVLEATDTDQDKKEMTKETLDTISSSVLYKASFTEMDNVIMNKVSSVTLNSTSVSLANLVDSTFDIASPLLKDGVITYSKATGQVTIAFSELLSVATISSLIDKLLTNPSILALVPTLIDVGLNSMSGQAAIAIDSLDFSNIDYSSELSIVKSVYSEIYDSGIQPMVQGNHFDVKSFALKTSTFTDQEIDTYVDALKQLGNLATFQKNIAVILASFGTYLKGIQINILPTDPASYADVDWSEDLGTLGSIGLHFFRDLGIDITPKLSAKVLTDSMTSALKDPKERSKLQTYILGSEEEEKKGVLDTSIFKALSIPDILSSTLSQIPAISPYLTDIDFATLLPEDYKSEFRTMFNMLNVLYGENSVIDLEDISKVDIKDKAVGEELSELLSLSKSSAIFKKLYPKILRNLLFHTNLDLGKGEHDYFYLFGLTPYNFNYDSDDFIDIFTQILNLLPDFTTLFDTLTDDNLTNAEKLSQFGSDTVSLIRELLNIVVTSDFFNADYQTGTSSSTGSDGNISLAVHNANAHTFLTNLFSSSVFKSLHFVVPSLEEMDSINWTDEIDNIGHLLLDVGKNAAFIAGENNKRSITQIADTDAFSDMITRGMDSELLRPSILSIIDTSMNSFLEEHGIHASFSSLRNSVWKEDSERIGDLIKIVKKVKESNKEITKMDPIYFNALMTDLANSKYILESFKGSDPFGTFLYEALQGTGLLSALGIKDLDASLFILPDGDSWSSLTGTGTVDGEDYTITTSGEIAVLTSFYTSLQTKVKDGEEKTYLDIFSEGKFPSGFTSSLKTEVYSSTFLRSLISVLLQSKAASFAVDDTFQDALQAIDFSLLKTMDADSFKKELSLFETLYTFSQEEVVDSDGNRVNKLSYISSHPFALKDIKAYPEDEKSTVTLLEETDELLDALASSTLMTASSSTKLCPYALILRGMINSSGLASKVAFSEGDSTEASLNGILLSVDDWVVETSNLKALFDKMQGIEPSSLTLESSSLKKDTLSDILLATNESTIFHRLAPSCLEEVFKASSIDDLLVDPDTGAVPYPLDFHKNLGTSADEISYWDKEINGYLDLLFDDSISSYFRSANGSKSSFENLKPENLSGSVLATLGFLDTFKGARDYFLYNLIAQSLPSDVKPSQFLKESEDAPYGENTYAYSFEELYFQEPSLYTNGVFDKEKAEKAAQCFFNACSKVTSKLSSLLNTTDLSSFSFDFEEFNATAFYTEGDTSSLVRSVLASSFIAGVEEGVFRNGSLPFKDLGFSSFDLKNEKAEENAPLVNRYFLVNPLEGRGLNGLLVIAQKSASLDTSNPTLKKSELSTYFKELGSKNASSGYEVLEKHFLALEPYKENGNSCFALTDASLKVLAALPVSTSTDPFTTLGNLDSYPLDSTSLATASFEEWIEGASIL